MALTTTHLIEGLFALAGFATFEANRPRGGYRLRFRHWAWRRRVDRSLRGVR